MHLLNMGKDKRCKAVFAHQATRNQEKIDSLTKMGGRRFVTQTGNVSSKRRLIGIPKSGEARPYQQECTDQLVQHFGNEGSSLLILPTGAGKTRVTMEAIRCWLDSETIPHHVLWIVHQEELCEQAEHSFEKTWQKRREGGDFKDIWVNTLYGGGLKPDAEMYNDGRPSFTISTPDSVRDWDADNLPEMSLIVYDEAHHGIAEQNRDVYERIAHRHRLASLQPLVCAKICTFSTKLILIISSFLEPTFGSENWQDLKEKMVKDRILSTGHHRISRHE